MLYMNDYDIMMAAQRANNPVTRKAVAFLSQFKDQVDSCSDGWAYWHAPVAAAKKLMELIQGKVPATEANYKAAMTPIKSFYTKRGNAAGMQMPVVY
jgi:hypothetical protein